MLSGATSIDNIKIMLVDDDDGVREVRLLVDGIEMAKLTAAPWRLVADVNAKARAKHEVVVVAVDPSGNEGRSAPLSITRIETGALGASTK